jgi:hypothetical protein
LACFWFLLCHCSSLDVPVFVDMLVNCMWMKFLAMQGHMNNLFSNIPLMRLLFSIRCCTYTILRSLSPFQFLATLFFFPFNFFFFVLFVFKKSKWQHVKFPFQLSLKGSEYCAQCLPKLVFLFYV